VELLAAFEEIRLRVVAASDPSFVASLRDSGRTMKNGGGLQFGHLGEHPEREIKRGKEVLGVVRVEVWSTVPVQLWKRAFRKRWERQLVARGERAVRWLGEVYAVTVCKSTREVATDTVHFNSRGLHGGDEVRRQLCRPFVARCGDQG